jgi:hypothetical protein
LSSFVEENRSGLSPGEESVGMTERTEIGQSVSVEEKEIFTGKKTSTFLPLTENSSVPVL